MGKSLATQEIKTQVLAPRNWPSWLTQEHISGMMLTCQEVGLSNLWWFLPVWKILDSHAGVVSLGGKKLHKDTCHSWGGAPPVRVVLQGVTRAWLPFTMVENAVKMCFKKMIPLFISVLHLSPFFCSWPFVFLCRLVSFFCPLFLARLRTGGTSMKMGSSGWLIKV